MSRLNPEGIRFVHNKTRPLQIDSMDAAAEAIASALTRKNVAEMDLSTPEKVASFARNLAWIIGFDAMINDRKAIHAVTSLVAEIQT